LTGKTTLPHNAVVRSPWPTSRPTFVKFGDDTKETDASVKDLDSFKEPENSK
jgi:hypothetical protein